MIDSRSRAAKSVRLDSPSPTVPSCPAAAATAWIISMWASTVVAYVSDTGAYASWSGSHRSSRRSTMPSMKRQ